MGKGRGTFFYCISHGGYSRARDAATTTTSAATTTTSAATTTTQSNHDKFINPNLFKYLRINNKELVDVTGDGWCGLHAIFEALQYKYSVNPEIMNLTEDALANEFAVVMEKLKTLDMFATILEALEMNTGAYDAYVHKFRNFTSCPRGPWLGRTLLYYVLQNAGESKTLSKLAITVRSGTNFQNPTSNDKLVVSITYKGKMTNVYEIEIAHVYPGHFQYIIPKQSTNTVDINISSNYYNTCCRCGIKM